MPACQLCGSSEQVVVGRRVSFAMGYTTVMCARCSLVYLAPRPDVAAFADFYRRLYPQLYGKDTVATEPSGRGRSVWEFVSPAIPDGGAVLDVGCGDAGLLRAFAAESAAAAKPIGALVGCDPGWPPGERSELEESGRRIDVRPVDVFELGAEIGLFDLVVLYDVLEHLLEPRRFLERLHAAAGPTTRLFISTNCLDHADEIPSGGWETYYLRLAHTFTFTRATLAGLLAAAGWRVDQFRPAAKGDQWVLAERAEPVAEPPLGSPDEALSLIARYRERCG
jgi:SAM-dependent methyltransferase